MSDPIQEAIDNARRRFVNDIQRRRDNFINAAIQSVVGLGIPLEEARERAEAAIPPIPGSSRRLTTEEVFPGLAKTAPGVPMSERILGSAAAHRGLTYQWGGVGNPSFDCSGLTQRAHRDNGITIGRTTYDQIKQGREIPWGQQQIGDLVFSRFSAPGIPEHVSIWAGNGKVFEAGNPLDYYQWGDRGTVRVRRMW